MNKYLIISIITIGMYSCNSKNTPPKGFPDEKMMTNILIDFHTIEAVMNNNPNSYNLDKTIIAGYYKQLFLKYDLTKEKFDAIMAWYADHPEIYNNIYAQVIATLSVLEAETQTQSKAYADSIEINSPKITNLWKDSTQYNCPLPDSIDKRIPFHIPVDSLKNGFYKLTAYYTFRKEDLSIKNQAMLIPMYADRTVDTIFIDIRKSFKRTSLDFVVDSLKPMPIINFSGFLLIQQSRTKPHVNIDGIEFQHIPQKELLNR